MFYQAPDQSLHFLDDDAFAFLLPEGSVPISTETAEALEAAKVSTAYVPISVAMWQARAALRRSHLLDQADAAVTASGNGDLIEYWQYATVLDEGNAMVETLATTIGLTDKQMHDLFVVAAAINL